MEGDKKIITLEAHINSGIPFYKLPDDVGVECSFLNREEKTLMKFVIYRKDLDRIIVTACELICQIDNYFSTFFENHNIILTFGGVDTASTDGSLIYCNPAYIYRVYLNMNKTYKGVAFVLLHEAFHISLGHNDLMYSPNIRKKYTNHKKTNIAMDLEVNYGLENFLFKKNKVSGKITNFFKGVSKELGVYYDDSYGGMTWREIYEYVDEKVIELEPDKFILWSDGTTEITKDELEKMIQAENNKDHFNKNGEWSDDAINGYNTIVDEFHRMANQGMKIDDIVSSLKSKYKISADIIKF